MSKITASYLYSGLPDYWGGDGRRHDNDAGCLFAFYGANTTLRDIIDSAVDDFCDGGDFYVDNADVDPWVDVSQDEVREALLACLTAEGRADYDNNVISEFAAVYAACNDLDKCRECGHLIGSPHHVDCDVLKDMAENGDIDDNFEVEVNVEPEDCADEDDCYDSPIVVFLLEIDE